jgi:hypothetical protein
MSEIEWPYRPCNVSRRSKTEGLEAVSQVLEARRRMLQHRTVHDVLSECGKRPLFVGQVDREINPLWPRTSVQQAAHYFAEQSRRPSQLKDPTFSQLRAKNVRPTSRKKSEPRPRAS